MIFFLLLKNIIVTYCCTFLLHEKIKLHAMQRFKNIFNFQVMDVYMFRCALHLRKPCFQNNINLDF